MESVREFLDKQLFFVGQAPITVAQVLLVPLVVIITLLLARWFERRITRKLAEKDYDSNLVLLIRRAFYVVVVIVLVLTSLGLLNVPLGAFTFISGAIAIGVGFGAQNVINNFISGWILMGERPIRIDDLLEIDGTLGYVESIGTRSTRIRRVDGVRIVMPNSYLLENTVINWTLVDQEVRIAVSVGVAYGSPVRKVAELLRQAVCEQEDVLRDPEPSILFQDFGDNALLFEAYFWTRLRPGGDHRRLRSEVRFRVDELFRDHGIVIAFPQRDVHLDGALQLVSATPPSEPAVTDEVQDLGGQ